MRKEDNSEYEISDSCRALHLGEEFIQLAQGIARIWDTVRPMSNYVPTECLSL